MEKEKEKVRLRLQFEDRNMLGKSKKKDGLKRSWLLLLPQLHTISELSSHIIHLFHLQRTCPDGLLLTMDGFTLPHFESTSIIKDKDLICVKKKKAALSDVVKFCHEANFFEDEEIVDKQPLIKGSLLLLANKEFENESGGYQSETEDEGEDRSKDPLLEKNGVCKNEVSWKRKASKKLQSTKRKKSKLATKMHPIGAEDLEEVENGTQPEQIRSTKQSASKPKKGLLHKYKVNGRETTVKKSSDLDESVSDQKSNDQLQENGACTIISSQSPDGSKKFPSRSARRKKAKRQWLRELAKLEKNEIQEKPSLVKNDQQECDQNFQQIAKKEDHITAKPVNQPDEDSEEEDEAVPVEIRPGHIRFEPLKKDPVGEQNKVPVENFQWNGITSKKKGQKWGTEKSIGCLRNDYSNFHLECSAIATAEEEVRVNFPVDFDKLEVYAGLPKEGDSLAYRLMELSSSWCPEVSSFRVGKISSYDPVSNRITLVPVPEHPVVLEKNQDEEGEVPQLDTSLYNEDGSLEIEFPSLIDVRVFKRCNLDAPETVVDKVSEPLVRAEDTMSNWVSKESSKQNNAPVAANGTVNAWDEISHALSAKKAELSKEDGSSQKPSSGKSSWSYKALRSSALGPTMALLRAQNEIDGNAPTA